MKFAVKHMGNPEYVSVGSEGGLMSWERRVFVQGLAGSILLSQPVLPVMQKASVHLISRKGVCQISLTFW